MPAWLPIAAAVAQGLGTILSRRGQEKKQQAQQQSQQQAQTEAARIAFQNQDQARIARLQGLIQVAKARGIDIPVDPGMLAPRQFPGLGFGDPAAGGGGLEGILGGLLGTAGEAGLAYGALRGREQRDQEAQDRLTAFLCSIGLTQMCPGAQAASAPAPVRPMNTLPPPTTGSGGTY